MINNTLRLGIETIIKSTQELIESEINTKPDVYLLLDTNLAIDSDFCKDTYHAKNYSELDTQKIEDAIKAVEFGLELLDNPIIFIVDGVISEAKIFFSIVSERIRFYNNSKKEGKPKIKKEKYHSSSLENNKNLYSELNDVCFGLKNKLNKAIYPIEDIMQYNQILDEVLKISHEENLKRNVFVEENIPRPFRRDHDKFDTDEELVALALYLNATKNRPVSILSKDSDIPRILEGISSTIETSDIKILNPYGKAVTEIRHNYLRLIA